MTSLRCSYFAAPPFPRRRPAPTAGFTLLEVLLALTLLAALTALIATIWAQLANTSTHNHALTEQMRIEHVSALLDQQWAHRRFLSRGSALGSAQQISDDLNLSEYQFTFNTTHSALFPDWPLVQVTYRIQPRAKPNPEGQELSDLILSEQRIVSFGEAEASRTRDAQGRLLKDEKVLLEDIVGLQFEQAVDYLIWLEGPRDIPWSEEAARWTPMQPPQPLQQEQTPGSDFSATNLRNNTASNSPATPEDNDRSDDPQALRLKGTWQERVLECVFIVKHSR